MNRPDPDNLERFVHRALRELPDRRAPLTLESRVLDAIRVRTAGPWWRQSYAAWPGLARAGLVLVTLALCAGVYWLFSLGLSSVSPSGGHLVFLAQARAVIGSLSSAVGTISRGIPLAWIAAAGFAIVGSYLALLGIGAATYRTIENR